MKTISELLSFVEVSNPNAYNPMFERFNWVMDDYNNYDAFIDGVSFEDSIEEIQCEEEFYIAENIMDFRDCKVETIRIGETINSINFDFAFWVANDVIIAWCYHED
jgi:hypothetical protein